MLLQVRSWNSEHTEPPQRRGAGGPTKIQPQVPPLRPPPKLLRTPVTVPRPTALAPRLLATVPSTSRRGGPCLALAPTSSNRKDRLSPRLGSKRNRPAGPEKTPKCLLAALTPPFDYKSRKCPSLAGPVKLLDSDKQVAITSRAPGPDHTCTPLGHMVSYLESLPPPPVPPHQEGRDNKVQSSG